MKWILALALTGIAYPAATAMAHPQIVGGQWDTLHRFDGVNSHQNLGRTVAGAEDVDGDGVPDLMVGTPVSSPGGRPYAGTVLVFSGATGGLLHRFDGQNGHDHLGSSIAGAGDLDGDGLADLIVGVAEADPFGLPDAGTTLVISGSSGTPLHSLHGGAMGDKFGKAVANAGDVDGDGVNDLIVGAPMRNVGVYTWAGSAYVYSGATGLLIHQFDGAAFGGFFGESVAGAGDVDGDGLADLVVGAWFTDPGGKPEAGSVFVYSGATGNLLHRFDGFAMGDRLGTSVAGAGDFDGDGSPDVVAGAYRASPFVLPAPGSAYVFSGTTGALLAQFDGESNLDWFGYRVGNAGDVNGDGLTDLIVSGKENTLLNGPTYAGTAFVYSGSSGDLLCRFDGTASGERMGTSVACAGDLDGDGLDDLIVGAEGADPGGLSGAGSAHVFSLDPYLHLDSDLLSVSSGSSVQLGMEFPASEAGARYVLLASITGTGPMVMAGLEIPLVQDILFNRILSGNAPAVLQGSFGTLNANSRAAATLHAGPALNPAIGRTVYFAAVTFEIAGPVVGRKSSVARLLAIVP